MITTDELRILLSVNGAASYTTTINEVTNVTNKYEKSVGNLISTLAKLVSVGAIVKFGKQCIEAASNLQEVANVVDVTFGASATKVNQWAKQNAASFGLSETAAKRYIGTYGTMAKQFNMTEEQAAAMGIELTKLTGDVASFYNLDDKAAATKLKAIFTGETEGLKELGVVMTETQLNSYAMAQGWGKTTKEMSEQEKVVLRYQYTMEKLSHAQGDFARTSDGYANSVRGLKLQLENFKVEIGRELIPVAAQGIQAISGVIQTVGPAVITVARYIRYYAEAWKNASASTKNFAKIALIAFGAMKLIPIAVSFASKAFDILFVKSLTLTTGLQALAGILGVIFAIAAMKKLSDSVKEMEKASSGINTLSDSANASTGAIDSLSDSLDGLNDSSKGLETFLASFDEVNKVGGGNSLMSGLVTKDDLANILDASLGIEDLQGQLDGLHLPTIIPEGIFTKQFWTDLGAGIMGFFEEAFFEPGEFWSDWVVGFNTIIDKIQEVGDWLDEVAPKWSNFWNNAGFNVYDLTHDKNGKPKVGAGVGTLVLDSLLGANEEDKTGSFTAANGITYAKYGADGKLSKPYEDYIRSNVQSKADTATASGNVAQSQTVDVTLLLDGRKIANVVTDLQNQKARSSGNQGLVGG